MQERFMDGQLVEVALTPAEAEGVRTCSKYMRETLEWLKATIAREDFDGDAALAAITHTLQYVRNQAAAPRET